MLKALLQKPADDSCLAECLTLDEALIAEEPIRIGLYIWKTRRLDLAEAFQAAGIDDVVHIWNVEAESSSDFYVSKAACVSPWSAKAGSKNRVENVPLGDFPHFGLAQAHRTALGYVKSTGSPIYQRISLNYDGFFCSYFRLLCPICKPSGEVAEAFSVTVNEHSRIILRTV